MDESIEILEKFLGKPETSGLKTSSHDPDHIKIPSPLSNFIYMHMHNSYMRKFFYIVDPNDYYSIMEDWYDNPTERHAFMKTGFGSLFYYNEEDQTYYRLDLATGRTVKMGKMLSGIVQLWIANKKSLEQSMWYKYYISFIKETGTVNELECLSFAPSLLLGGSVEESDVHKVKIREYSSIQAQLASD